MLGHLGHGGFPFFSADFIFQCAVSRFYVSFLGFCLGFDRVGGMAFITFTAPN